MVLLAAVVVVVAAAKAKKAAPRVIPTGTPSAAAAVVAFFALTREVAFSPLFLPSSFLRRLCRALLVALVYFVCFDFRPFCVFFFFVSPPITASSSRI